MKGLNATHPSTLTTDKQVLTSPMLPVNDPLFLIFIWQIHSDNVLLDWYIRLKDKEYLSHCEVVQFITEDSHKLDIVGVNSVKRILRVENLESNTFHNLCLKCVDQSGFWHTSNIVNFTTGKN